MFLVSSTTQLGTFVSGTKHNNGVPGKERETLNCSFNRKHNDSDSILSLTINMGSTGRSKTVPT